MSSNARIAVVVLAAGQSRRFGASDKLLSHYNGKPLASHVAASLYGLPFTFGAVVARNRAVAGLFRSTRLKPLFPKKTTTQSESLRAGLKYAESRGASHVLLLLGDMPHVSRQHLKQMLGKISYHPVLSKSAKTTLPPTLIPRKLFRQLSQLHGDKGAGHLLRRYPNAKTQYLAINQARDVDRRDHK